MYILLAIVCILHRYLQVRELQVSDRQVVTLQNWSAWPRSQKSPLLSATFFTMWLRLHISLSYGIVTARARAPTLQPNIYHYVTARPFFPSEMCRNA